MKKSILILFSLIQIGLKAGTITVFPNPVAERISVKVKDQKTLRSAEIYNYLGKKVMILPIISGELRRADLSSLSKGRYFLKVTLNSGKSEIQQFIKK